MNLLHTEYHCVECGIDFKKVDSIYHQRQTDHEIIKKIVYPKVIEANNHKVDILPEDEIQPVEQIDYCVDCRKEVFLPELHRKQAHTVFKTKKEII